MWAAIKGFFGSIKAWLYGIVLALVAGLGIYAEVEHKGKVAAQQTTAAHDAEVHAKTAENVVHNIETKDEITAQVNALPAPATSAPTKVGDALAGTAAGKLRDEFSRD
jgi:hypothetical protein